MMKHFQKIFLFAMALGFWSCGNSENQQRAAKNQPDVLSAGPVQWDKAEISHAKHFKVEYHENYKVVKTSSNLKSWSGGESRQKSDVVVLVQRGTKAPELEGELKDAQIIYIPAEKVAVNIANGESFLNELGLTEKIVAVGGVGSYSDTLRQAAISGKIGQVGYSWHQPPQMEVLLQRSPDVFFMQLSNLDYQEHLGKCRQVGIPTATVFEWAEDHYLGRAEWIKFYSLFFNEEAKANEIFEKIESRVDSLKQIVEAEKEKPTAIWGYYAGKDKWYFNANNLESRLMEDAGLKNLFANKKEFDPDNLELVTSEQLLKEGKDAEHWIIGDIHSASLPPASYMNAFQAWRNGKLYHNMKRSKMDQNAYDWYGTAVVRPDYVLADIVSITRPHLLPDYKRRYMDDFDKNMKLPILKSRL